MENKRSESAKKAWATRNRPTYKASKNEKASKKALEVWCKENGWQIVFFEGKSGAPRTGIVDAVMVRIKPKNADAVEIKFVQLKSGNSGLTAKEISRLKKSLDIASTSWLMAAFDGKVIHFLPELSEDREGK